MIPLCIDLFCGLGGWAEGFLAEGYQVIGFDVERHDYGTGRYPGELVLQDVLTLHGRITKRRVGNGSIERVKWWRRGQHDYPQYVAMDLERLGWTKILETLS